MDPHEAKCSGWSQCDKDNLQKEAMKLPTRQWEKVKYQLKKILSH
jgi:hypothetical protein